VVMAGPPLTNAQNTSRPFSFTRVLKRRDIVQFRPKLAAAFHQFEISLPPQPEAFREDRKLFGRSGQR
jgi:hypothetical protein